MERPNILLIMTDQQFAGAMSCTGNGDLHTPNMDRLAASGVRFDECYCAQPLCTPSRAAMFHGRMPVSMGIRGNNEMPRPEVIAQGMGRLISEAGYHCGYGGKWHVGPAAMPEQNEHGFERIGGFDDNALPEACARFLGRRHDRPWLLVASFDNPHNICEYARNEPLPWLALDEPPIEQCPGLPANFYPPPYEPQMLRMAMQGNRRVWPTIEYTVDQWRRLRNAYYRLCEYVDGQVGQVLEALRRTDQVENTVILFTSDHGDGHGAHQWNQKWAFYEESARVPLIVVDPRVQPARRGAVEAERLVNNGIDLLPTVLDYAGATDPADLPGRSVRALVEGRDVIDWPDQLVSETDFDGPDPGGGRSRNGSGRMLRTSRYKYSVFSWGQDREQLFDMRADPGEMVDLTVQSRYRDVLNEHRRRLRQWCEANGDRFLPRVPEPT